MALTQEQYQLLKQPITKRYIKLYILNFNFQRVNEISGYLISCSVAGDANSDLRHNCKVSLSVTDSSFDIQSGGQIWLDKYINPYIGSTNLLTQEIVWENQGIYLINAPSWEYDATTNVLNLEGLDLISKLTGLRNGELEGLPTTILQDENVRNAILAIMAEAGFSSDRCIVSECINSDGTIQSVPYDISVQQGSTVWNLLTSLRDILPQYQMYFDKDGYFHYDLIPSGANMFSDFDDDLLKEILIKETINTDFESVKNYIEVYGKTHDVQFFGEIDSISTVSNISTINLTINSLAVIDEYVMIGWVTNSAISSDGIKLNVNEWGDKKLVDYNGNYITSLPDDLYCVAQYQSNNTWLFLGHLQAQAIYYDNNPDSPFYTDGTNNVIRHVCVGGDYENIQSDELALERAKLEIYWRCRLNDSISLSVIPVPWLEVNTLFTHAVKNGRNKEQWIIDSYSVDYTETGEMSITAHKYYPLYPII